MVRLKRHGGDKWTANRRHLRYSSENSQEMEKSFAVLLATFWLTAQAHAFEIDGYFSGMTKASVLKTLAGSDVHAEGSGTASTIKAGAYEFSFCQDRLSALTKYVTKFEFDELLRVKIAIDGEPRRETPALNSNVHWLRWGEAPMSMYSLNYSLRADGTTVYNVTVFDNFPCPGS